MEIFLDLLNILVLGGVWGGLLWFVAELWRDWYDRETNSAKDHNDFKLRQYLLKSRRNKTFLAFWTLGIFIYLVTTGLIWPGLYGV